MTIRRHQIRTIGASVDKLVKPIFGARGFGASTIVTRWADIVGTVLARETLPERIAYPAGERCEGTLHLRVANAGLALELQHLEPQVVERINSHFGYRAVARIRLTQGPLPPRAEAKTRVAPPIAPETRAALDRRVATVDDPELRAALRDLGTEVARADGGTGT